ncbi:MAG TPA: hypothetical protein VGH44_03260 [Candidatus Saccharimonadia bacterium]|jgi:hypothetical protein
MRLDTADWATIASLATAAGTLVLALATFASVRSANRSAQVSERAFLSANRPLLVASQLSDPTEKVRFQDDHWVKLQGGHAYADSTDQAIYLAIALRNAGQGLALLDRWRVDTDPSTTDFNTPPPDPQTFRRLTRDLYITPGFTGFWQGAMRDPHDPQFGEVRAAIAERRLLLIDIEYADQEGGQRTTSRFAMTPFADNEWIPSIARHWRLDGHDPRQ